jgi:hypothetical protein
MKPPDTRMSMTERSPVTVDDLGHDPRGGVPEGLLPALRVLDRRVAALEPDVARRLEHGIGRVEGARPLHVVVVEGRDARRRDFTCPSHA